MKKTTVTLRPFLMIGTAMALVLSSCTDSDYDFNEIDSTIGIGGDGIELPSISTKQIPLKDVLELEENGSIVEDATTGDYVFRQDGANVAPVHPSIQKITIAKQAMQSFEVPLNSARRTRANAALTASGKLQAFTYEGNAPSEVLDLSKVEVDSKIQLTIDFSDVKSTVTSFDEIDISFPSFMTLTNVLCNNKAIAPQNNTLKLTKVPTSSKLVITATMSGLDFTQKTPDNGTLTFTNGKIQMKGDVTILAKATNYNAASVSGKKITSTMTISDIIVNTATGRFNPHIALNDLGNISVTGIPDFLEGGNVVVDLYNPMIKLTTTSNMEIPGIIDGVITSYKNGKELASVEVNNIPIDPNTTSTVCISRRPVSGFDHNITNDTLSTLIETIPDKITFTANATADSKNEYSFELGKDYEIQPAYSIDAPIAFGKNATIEYRDNFSGWNDDVKDLSFADGAYILMTAEVTSCVPAYMNVKIDAIDANGNAIGNDQLAIDIDGYIPASPNGITEQTSTVNIKISEKTKGALHKVDGLNFTVTGKADGENGAVEGITLNANKHTLKVNNISIKLVGKIIGDFN